MSVSRASKRERSFSSILSLRQSTSEDSVLMGLPRYRKSASSRYVIHPLPIVGAVFYKLLEVDMDTETGELSRRKALKEPNVDRSSVKKNTPCFCVKGGASSVATLDTCVKIARELGPKYHLPMSRRAPSLARNSAPDPQVSFVHPNRFS